ncbi:MAG TPA: ATP-binding protein [Candidatus Saccharimonadales bacterium]|nr:ATP-binding protein [Candidatus Saccharimonadales bacterium]
MEIRITDDGRGIDNSIFEEMFSKYKTNSDDGLGLGLYVAKSIIEAHGGQIKAQNNKNGKGATISFCIPVNEK